MDKKNDIKALRSGVWYTAATFLEKGLWFFTIPLFSRLLSKAEFGIYNNYIAWLNIIAVFVTLNLDSTFPSAKYDYKDEFDEYMLSLLSLSTAAAVLWTAVCCIFGDRMAEFFCVDKIYLIFMAVYLLFLSAVNLFQANERFEFHYKISVAVSISISFGSELLALALVLMCGDRLMGRIIGSVLPTIVIGTFLFALIVKRGRRIRRKYIKYALPIALPYVPHLLSMIVLGSIDKIMITKICGAEDNAMYSLVYSCGCAVYILLISMNTAFSPWLAKKLAEDSRSEVRAMSAKYFAFFSLGAIGVMLIAPEILAVLGGKEYSTAIFLMPPITLGGVFQFAYTMNVNVEQIKKKTIGMAFASLSAALLNYALNAVFIPIFGYVAAAYTTVAGYIWLYIVHLLIVRYLKYSDVYKNGKIALMLVGMVIVAAFVNILYRFTVLRYCVLAAYMVFLLGLAVLMKDVLLAFVKKD